MLRVINAFYIFIIITGLILIGMAAQRAIGAPSIKTMALSIKTIEAALNIQRGARFQMNVGGEQISITYIGIEPMKGRRYAIIVEAY